MSDEIIWMERGKGPEPVIASEEDYAFRLGYRACPAPRTSIPEMGTTVPETGMSADRDTVPTKSAKRAKA